MAHATIDSTDKRKRWRARNPEKDRAHRIVENYVRRLKRAGLPLPTCEFAAADPSHVCKGKIHAMHHDYAKPLEVRWGCNSAHIIEHWETEWREKRANGEIRVHKYTIDTVKE